MFIYVTDTAGRPVAVNIRQISAVTTVLLDLDGKGELNYANIQLTSGIVVYTHTKFDQVTGMIADATGEILTT